MVKETIPKTLGQLRDVNLSGSTTDDFISLGSNGIWYPKNSTELGLATSSDLTTHTSDLTNPHTVTKTQVGLSNVPNTDFTTSVGLNTTHRTSDGKNHSDVVLNNAHRTGTGSDHSDVATNTTHRGLTNNPHTVTAAQVGSGTAQWNANQLYGSNIDSSVASASDGKIIVFRSAGNDWVLEDKPAGGANPALNDITDVNISSVSNNNLLSYDTSIGSWINKSGIEAGLAIELGSPIFTTVNVGTRDSNYIQNIEVTQNSDGRITQFENLGTSTAIIDVKASGSEAMTRYRNYNDFWSVGIDSSDNFAIGDSFGNTITNQKFSINQLGSVFITEDIITENTKGYAIKNSSGNVAGKLLMHSDDILYIDSENGIIFRPDGGANDIRFYPAGDAEFNIGLGVNGSQYITNAATTTNLNSTHNAATGNNANFASGTNAYTETDGLVKINCVNSSDTGRALYIPYAGTNAANDVIFYHKSGVGTGTLVTYRNDGTGIGANYDQNGNAIAVQIDSEATSNPLLNLLPINANTRGDIAFGTARTADPGSPSEGDFWYNSTDNKIRYYDGTSTITLSAAGTGDVSKVGTPVNDQVGVWTGDGTIEGNNNLTFNGSDLFVGSNITLGGTVDGIDIATDVAANTLKVTNATHSGDVTGSGALTIANDAVTYAKMQNVVNDERILGRVSGADGIVEELTKAQVLTMIGVEDGAEVNNISDANATDLTDSGETTLHYHDADRARANHTGTQLASTISDFEGATGSYSINNIVEDTSPQLGSDLDLNSNGIIIASQTIDGSASVGDITYFDGTDWNQTDADAEATSKGMLGIVLGGNKVLTYGPWTTTGLTAGSPYYLSTTAGDITLTAPSATGDIVRIVGYALSTTQLMFIPDGTYIEIS